ncbi:MAG TPA: DUF2782 domain-containing protein [Gammaproteobacteria bacterium]|nr:DUF2782 domain-containing protein [Gammaproteobacteria bacterium]|tara:strand:+ start:2148 stop:2522 length:375 start_codon:yes stop_codon:yes gene_type:complete
MSVTLLHPEEQHRQIVSARRPHLRALSVLLVAGILLDLLSTTAAAQTALQGPDVVISASDEEVVYEYRQNGQLRMIQVVPSWGKPYYLVPKDPTRSDGDLERVDGLVPSWRLIEFGGAARDKKD